MQLVLSGQLSGKQHVSEVLRNGWALTYGGTDVRTLSPISHSNVSMENPKAHWTDINEFVRFSSQFLVCLQLYGFFPIALSSRCFTGTEAAKPKENTAEGPHSCIYANHFFEVVESDRILWHC